MPKTYIVDLGPEDVAIIKSETGTLKRRVTPDPRKQVDVTGYASAAVKPYPAEQVTCSGGTEPPPVVPPPVPGEALAVFTFEPGDFELWERHPAFEQGRSKTHDIPPPPIVGSFDLRMKYANGKPDGGMFQPGQRGVARRTFKVKPGTRTLLLYGVAHDDGAFIVRIIDEDVAGRPAVLSSTGSDYWNENQYLTKFFDFVLQGEHVTVEFDYTAPPLNKESGIKIGYGEIT